MLTDTAIRTAKPKEKPYRLFDGKGLYLEVSPAGGKWWRMKYRFEGKEKRLSLGVYPDVGVKEARARLGEARELLAQGIDPSVERRQRRDTERFGEGPTFEAVARDWFKKARHEWTPGYQEKILARLERQIFPFIGGVPILKLATADYLEAVRKAEARGAIDTAHRLAQLCGQVCRFAIHAGIMPLNPAAEIRGALARTRKEHRAAITDPQAFGALLCDIDAYDAVGDPVVCHALKIMPYVFVRSGELRGAAWDELDLEGGQWVIPAGRMKMKREHIVPLAPQVVRLFRSLQAYSGGGRLAFPGARSSTQCLSDMALLAALRRMGYAKEVMSVHGFRTSASTMLNELGFNRDWIEAQLAHAERNAVRDAYNRADWLPQRRDMMLAWADYIDAVRLKAGAGRGNRK